jgi:hypothetical protein
MLRLPTDEIPLSTREQVGGFTHARLFFDALPIAFGRSKGSKPRIPGSITGHPPQLESSPGDIIEFGLAQVNSSRDELIVKFVAWRSGGTGVTERYSISRDFGPGAGG